MYLAKYSHAASCVCCKSEEEKLQIERSLEIDRFLTSYKRKLRSTQKIVLLGAGESGKSTFLKQMQIIHGSGFTDEQKISYRTQIYENILKGIVGLINGKRDLKLTWRANSSGNNEAKISAYPNINNILVEFSTLYNKYMEKRIVESNESKKVIQFAPEQFGECVVAVSTIWNDEAIREAYQRRREFPKYFVENVPYFMRNLNRIGKKDYIPNIEDILWSRRATTGINEIEMNINGVPFQFIDVGGQRTQRQKWQLCFNDVTAILFLASSSEYDEYLREDGQTNRLEESCKIFETLVNYKYLRDVQFILFLNKYDLLMSKYKQVSIKNYCKDFNGDANNIEDIKNYLVEKFLSLKNTSIEKEDINYRSLKNTRNNNSQFDSLENEITSNNENNNNNKKLIYKHFTTAIDTSNINTIFELVRLMIFKRNLDGIYIS